eukprot:CAMPEP_0115485292 /NCGR_PEP_ID=MMETSP0271-20121206/59834_1 /TAXON_ID=71861 /ORGANISM="Scrippsiella trochoidea, Strain CCMP3099" /LENGTH=167 /DNA_ID=CAMNT_0002913245 /DNA_START=313 /DNA_END=816 /DNA_ORIENTATION=+
MSFGRDTERRLLAPARTGVGGGKAAWIKVFCTMKPKLPNVDGVSGFGAHAVPILLVSVVASELEQAAGDAAGGFKCAFPHCSEDPVVACLRLTLPSSFGSGAELLTGNGEDAPMCMPLSKSFSISSMHNGTTMCCGRPWMKLHVLTATSGENLSACGTAGLLTGASA